MILRCKKSLLDSRKHLESGFALGSNPNGEMVEEERGKEAERGGE